LEAVNQCRIETNTTRFHNEIIKHRLSCIPIHVEERYGRRHVCDHGTVSHPQQSQ
jgi:hypothetical protein